MKKVLLSLGVVLLSTGAVLAQDSHAGHNHGDHSHDAKTLKAATVAPAATGTAKPSTSLSLENLSFAKDAHDFGTIAEGPAADYEFTFKNTGKEPIVLNQVQASCGCTTPSWSKDPVLPGKTGSIKASYSTPGRPGPFTKTITVTSNAGVKVLTIKGNVEKAPESSVPQNTSMIKTN